MYRQVLRRRTKCPVADRHDLQFATRLARRLTDDNYHHTPPPSSTDDPHQPHQRNTDDSRPRTTTHRAAPRRHRRRNLDPRPSRLEHHGRRQTLLGLITVRGTFTSATGHADVNADGTVTATLEVDAASITTKNKKRDQHLRSDTFFNVEYHPTITFTTNDVTVVDDTTVRVSGVVTARGAKQTTTFDATLAADDDSATVAAEVVIDHKTLGMTWSPLGMTKPTTLVTLALTYTRT
jgi:polyisoprenoid-binding protein YceI